jgi:signal transduction histidine kinase
MDENASSTESPVRDLSHELLNDLMIVIGECDLLHEEFLDAEVTMRLHRIRETAVRMSRRVTDHQIRAVRNTH